MSSKHRFLSILLAIVLSLSLTTTALAAPPSQEVLDAPPESLSNPPTTPEAAAELLARLNETAGSLHLSTDSLTLEAGKYYEVQVLPVDYAQPLGWKIAKIELSNPNAELCAVAPEGVEVISTLPTPASQTLSVSDSQTTPPSSTPPALSFIVKALRSGKLDLRVTLQNPTWQWLEPDNPLHTQVVASEHFEATQSQLPRSERDDDDDHDSSSTTPQPPVTGPVDPGPVVPDPGPNDPTQPEDPNPGPKPEDPKPGPNPDDPQPPALSEYDTTGWLFDPDSLEFTYDGETHLPVLTGVPSDVQVTLSVESADGADAAINAGTYTIKAEFEVPAGYKPVAAFSTNFTIEPAHLQFSQTYDRETGTIVPVLSGMVDGDVADVTTAVNGTPVDDAAEPVLAGQPGSYTVSTSVSIGEGKEGNYVFDSAPAQTTLVNVEQSKSWYKIEMSSRMEDGNIVIDFNLADLKTEQVGTTKALGLEFNLDYDHERLEYTETNMESGYWHMFYDEARDKEYGYYFGFTGPLPSSASICHLTFKVKDGTSAEDLIVSVRDSKATAAPMDGNAMDFIYTAPDTAIVVNPTGAIAVETVVVEGNPLDDVIYRGDHRLEDSNGNPVPEEIAKKEADLKKLEQYVAENFPSNPTNPPASAPNSEPADTSANPSSDSNAATPGSDVSSDVQTDDQGSAVRTDSATQPSTPAALPTDLQPAGGSDVTEREPSSIVSATDSDQSAQTDEAAASAPADTPADSNGDTTTESSDGAAPESNDEADASATPTGESGDEAGASAASTSAADAA